MAENDDDTDFPEAEDFLGSHPTPSAAQCLIDAAISAALPKDDRRRFASGELLFAVALAPSASWVKPLVRRAQRLLGNSWTTIWRDGSSKLHAAEVGNDEVADLVAKARSVIGIAPSEKNLPAALVTMADIRIQIAPPDAAVIAAAVSRYTNEKVAPEMAVAAVGLDFEHLRAAFRPDSSAQQIIDRIRAAQTAQTSSSIGRVPDISSAVEYGAVRIWAMGLVEDFAAYRKNELEWHDVVDPSVIIHGNPGLGKTFLMQMLAQALGAQLIITSVAEMFQKGSGYLDAVIKNLSAVYDQAEASKPAVVVFDEIDGFPSRATMDARSASYWTNVVTHFMLLVSTVRPSIVQVGITNHIDKLDPALLRPGRFGRTIELLPPDAAGVVSIIRNQLRGELAGADLSEIGDMATHRTAAELMQAVQVARRAARLEQRPLAVVDLRNAIIPPHPMPPDVIRRIAVHECGHVAVAIELKTDEVVHAAIGGLAGAHGQTIFRPTPGMETARSIEARATTMLAGRAAEIVVFGSSVAGSSSDLREATALIGEMIACEGLSGPLISLGERGDIHDVIRLDRLLRADVEARLQRLNAKAIEIVRRRRPALDAMAEVLATHRYLAGAEARRLFASAPVAPEPVPEPTLESADAENLG